MSSIIYVMGLMLILFIGNAGALDTIVPYEIEKSGKVSLGIYDSSGKLVRMLQSCKKQEPGKYEIKWDGKDDEGKEVNKGDYVLKGVISNIGWEYQMMMGNSGRPPYLTADGKGGFGGVWGNVKDCVVDSTGVYLLWGMEEGTPALLKVNPNGETGNFVIWGAHNNWSWGYCQSIATDGEYVYVANNVESESTTEKGKKVSKGLIWRVRADNGDYENYDTGENGLIKISEILVNALPPSWDMYVVDPDRPFAWEMYADPSKRLSEGFRKNLFGLAVDNTYIYCSLRQENKVVILDKKTGARIKEISVKDPAGMMVTKDDNIYVISGQSVIELSSDGEKLGTVISKGLVAPYDLTIDREGSIYVSDQSTSMQIKVFNKQGKLIKHFGKPGGHAYGGEWKKMKNDLLFPTGLAVADDGTIYVGEDFAPKRVAIIKNEKIIDEWIGPLSGGCNMLEVADEDEPEYVYHAYHLPVGGLVRYRVDYNKKTWILDAVWGYYILANDSTGNRLIGGIKKNGVYQIIDGGGGYIRHLQGKTFLFLNNLPLLVFRIEGYDLIPSAVVSNRFSNEPMEVISIDWKNRPSVDPQTKTHPYTWHDRNGDWEASEDEVDWSISSDYKFVSRDIQPFVDYDLTIYAWGWKLVCDGLDEKGNPIYSWSKAEKLPLKPMGKLADPSQAYWVNTSASIIGLNSPGDIYPGGREVNIWLDKDGSYYFESDVEGKGKGIGWASSGIFARLGKADKNGNWLWMNGEKATGFVKHGQFYKISNIAGIIENCVFVCDWNGQVRVFDKDTGLYVGSLFSDGYKGARPDENLVSVELTEAHVFTHPKTGENFALAGDGCGLKIFRITGLKDIKRFNKRFKI